MNLKMSFKSVWKLADKAQRIELILYIAFAFLASTAAMLDLCIHQDATLVVTGIVTAFYAVGEIKTIRRDIVIRLLVAALQRKETQHKGA